MKNSNLYSILDLIEEIQNTDRMIEIHSDSGASLMLKQYKNQKLKLTNILIDNLIFKEENPENMYLVKLMIEKFYKNEINHHKSIETDHNLKKIEEAFAS